MIELLHIDDRARQFIYEGNMLGLMQSLTAENFQSFAQAARSKVLHGLTTTAEVERVLGRRFLKGS